MCVCVCVCVYCCFHVMYGTSSQVKYLLEHPNVYDGHNGRHWNASTISVVYMRNSAAL